MNHRNKEINENRTVIDRNEREGSIELILTIMTTLMIYLGALNPYAFINEVDFSRFLPYPISVGIGDTIGLRFIFY